jgi:iron complex outermembrane recepter protein
LKTRLSEHQRLDLALFHIGTTDEIVVASSSGGRTVYTNAGKTRRTGIELTHSAQWTPEWRSHIALSTLNASFAESFSSGGTLVASGNRIPGVLDRSLFGEIAWQPRALPGFTAALETVVRGSMVVDDVNSDRTASATLFNLRLGWEQKLGAWKLREYLRIDNLADKSYVGSVIANDGNRRFFEPAPGRQWGLGVTVSYAF